MKTDQLLKADVAAELAWDTAIDHQAIIGVASSEQCIRPLLGVKGVTNHIRIRPQPSSTDIESGILSALTRHAQREARNIAIQVEGGVVTLRGKVGSLRERDAAIGTAQSTKGVTRVIDHLQVTG